MLEVGNNRATATCPQHILKSKHDGVCAQHACHLSTQALVIAAPYCVQDMTTLSYLNEPGVLWNLKARYQLDGIYTYTGSILIAVNPFASLPLLYGQHMMQQYKGRPLGELSPHVYAIADAAFKQMRKDNKSQSILVCTIFPAAAAYAFDDCTATAPSSGTVQHLYHRVESIVAMSQH